MNTISNLDNQEVLAVNKPKQKVAFIIGNGFNFLIQNIINNYPDEQLPPYLEITKEQIAESIGQITTLWKRFDELLSDIRKEYDQVNDEELIRMIYTVIDFFSSIEAFEKVLGKEVIDKLKHTFDFLLIERIRAIAEEFRNHETSQGGYKDLKSLFPGFGDDFNSLINNYDVETCDFFTTNYDGVLDTLLTRSRGGFMSSDGFGNHPEFNNYLRLYNDNLYAYPIRRIHIHGSYKFEKKYGDTYKARKDSGENLDPVIIFNNPQLKETLIRRDPVLSHYFAFMADSISEANKLIILGNSMTNEPHIRELIRRKFLGKDKKLYVCSRNPDDITAQLKGYYNGTLIQRTTKDINTIYELLDFISSIFAD